MRTRTVRTGHGSRSAWLKAFCAMCCLVISWGTISAADPGSSGGSVQDDRDTSATPLSSSTEMAVTASSAGVNPEAPTVAGCPVIALVSDGSTSGNERGPNSNFLAGRGVYLITAAELTANGLVSGTVPSAIGYRYTALPGVAATGSLKIYLQNTADTTNIKSNTWTTAITGMTLVHNGTATTLPNTTAPFDIPFSGTGISTFTYTGGALYVAFDWLWAGPATTGAVVACNTALVNGNRTGQGATSPATVAVTNFRPETRLTPSVATVINDASVDFVMSLGSLAQPLVGPQTVQAVVSNRGINALTNLPVTLNITGADTFTNGQIVPSLAACGGSALVTFAPFTPGAIGADVVAVSVPADDAPANSTRTKALDETFNLYSYKHPGSAATGGVGLNVAGVFVSKLNITQAAKVSEIKLEFFAASATTYRAVIYGDSGSGTPSLAAPLYLDAANRTVVAAGPVTITLPTPVSVGPGNFYVGIQQTNTTNAALSYDNEVPIRAGSFYLATAIPPASWIDFAPGNNFKLNIGATLIQCTTVADCNDNNACTDDACTNQLCSNVNNNSTSCDGNPCSNPDQCVNGTCIPGPNPCADTDACTIDLCNGQDCFYNPVDCNDNNPCTDDFCIPQSGCAHSNNTGACSDGSPCTIGDVCSGGLCVPGSGALPAPVQFCNNAGVAIPTVGAATPYPSTIVVTGQSSYLCKTTVDLNGISHTFPSDIDVLLARLSGSNAIIMSDVGADVPVVNVSLNLSDSAATSLPGAAALTSGSFKPTNVGGGDVFPAPAPAPTGGSALSAFTGTNPNGTWNLWVDDQFSPDGGTIAAWCVNLTSVCLNDADCNDGNVCTNDSCAGSQCTHTNNTNACDDANACTANDACSNGTCAGGPPPPCDDGNACTANACNPGTGLCENPPIVCNDSNACTDDTCETATGCVFTADDNNVCTDNSLCTSPDVCLNGACVGQNPVVCTPDANACTTEACNPATGTCGSVNNTSACDDGNPCTTGDTCGPAFTENFDGETAPNLPFVWATGVTGTGNPWTTVGTSSDTAPNSAFGFDGAAVADEVLISPPINIVSASAQLTFRSRWSFETSGGIFYDGCVLEISIGGGPFDDILVAGGSFVSGGYTGVLSAGFSNPLGGRSAWAAASAGYPAYLTTIVNLPAAAAGQSIQLQWRIGTDTSAGAPGQNIDSIVVLDGGTHSCQPGPAADCADVNPCTDDYCDSGLGCQHANNTESCEDGNACTIVDTCAAGACGGTLIVCNDSNPCTADSCDAGSGCLFAPITAPPETAGVAAPNKTTYTWTPATYATQYDVVRGSLAAFPVGPAGGDEVCFNDLAGTSVSDATLPSPGAGFWYLSRGQNACGNGSYGTQSNATPRSSTTCP